MTQKSEERLVSPHVEDRHHFAELLARTSGVIVKHLQERESLPVDCSVPPRSIREELMKLSLPADGMTADEILTFVETYIVPWAMPMTHPRSYGWVNSPPAPAGILCEVIATAMKGGLDSSDTPSACLMHSLGRWLMELSGFVDESGTPQGMALLLAGGSAANLNALTVARFWAARRDGWNIREEGLQGHRPAMVYYASAEAHSSVQLCVEQLGIGTRNLRKIDTDDAFRMRPDALRASIEADLSEGVRPACVIGSCGSTNVGAIDPIDEMADICEAFDLWLHVDGAYGGIAGLDPAYAEATRALNRVDSLTLDPHKWLQAPLDCGALLVRDSSINQANYSLVPDYLASSNAEDGMSPEPWEHMFELTFADRSLKTWASIARLGREGVREMVINCNNLARLLGERVEEARDLEILSPPSISTVNFRYKPNDAALTDRQLDTLNQKISDAIADSGEAHIPTTKVHGAVSLRACFLHYENREEDVYHLVALVQKFGEQCQTKSA